ncbi:MAG: hypothetical protein KDK02_01990 [Rhodobacteraceae bacterium]|nr:hypothetical protein [Paracoccaceae bacterium]
MRRFRILVGLAMLAGLAACGDTPAEQALYGAGAGMLGSYVVDGNPFVGAAAGAAGNVVYCQQFPDKCG